MNTIAKLTLGMLLFAGPLAMDGQEGKSRGEMLRAEAGADEVGVPRPALEADQPKAEDPAAGDEAALPRPKLVEPARTLKEALERRSAEEAAAGKELEAARKAYEDRLAAANQRTVADLTVIARRSVADGQLPDAAKAREEVLRLDPENEGAKAFFQTIGRLDEVQKRLAKIPGDDRRVWIRAESNKPAFVLQSDGTWREIRTTGDHKSWIESGRDEYTIELSQPNGQVLRIHPGRFYWSTESGDRWRSGSRGYWKR